MVRGRSSTGATETLIHWIVLESPIMQVYRLVQRADRLIMALDQWILLLSIGASAFLNRAEPIL